MEVEVKLLFVDLLSKVSVFKDCVVEGISANTVSSLVFSCLLLIVEMLISGK